MAGNVLWAHLLRKDTTTTESPSQVPVIAPKDRTGTSMRMLIHDTQVNLEKFSTRLDSLLQHVDDCRAQVTNAYKLLDVERDKVLTEILEIAHRSQSELKAHIGTPSQASALDLVHVSQVSAEKSVQALEKRVDALQALLQSHAHVMQSIQDQQNTLIGAVLPLVPILHGVPTQIDQIKAAISDGVANAVSTMTSNIDGVRSTLVAELAHGHGQMRSSTRIGSLSKSISSSQRKRSDTSILCPQEDNVPVSSPLDTHGHGGPHPRVKRARIEGKTHRAGNAQLPCKLSRLISPTNSSDPPLLRTPHTPRRPLADLLFIPSNSVQRAQHHTTGQANSTSHTRGCMRSRDTFQGANGRLTNSPSLSRPLLQPLDRAYPHLRDSRTARRRSAELHSVPSVVDKSTLGLSNAARPSDEDTLKIEEVLCPNLSGVFSLHSSPLSSLPSSSLRSAIPHDLNETSASIAKSSTQQHSKPRNDMSDAPQVELASGLFSSNPDASPPKSMSLRDRRAQMSRFGRSETRRFIPMVPWSDEEE